MLVPLHNPAEMYTYMYDAYTSRRFEVDMTFGQDAIEYMSQERDSLTVELGIIGDCIKQLSEERIKKLDQMTNMRSELQSSNGEFARLTTQLQESKELVKQVQMDMSALTLEREKIRVELSEISSETGDLRKSLDQARKAVSDSTRPDSQKGPAIRPYRRRNRANKKDDSNGKHG
jgi:chromosome segregation ATPase